MVHLVRGTFHARALAVGLTAVSAMAAPAAAGDNDIVLARLAKVETGDGGVATSVVGRSQFRSLVSELGVVLVPRLLTPSSTIGFAGFQFSADVGYTSISHDATYWRVLQSSAGPTDASHGNQVMPTVGMFARKGLWPVVPSVEVGAGLVHLLDSHLFAAQGYAKLGLHEEDDDLPLPSFAACVARSRGSWAQTSSIS